MLQMIKTHRKLILSALVIAVLLTMGLILLSTGPQQGAFVYQLF